MNSRYAVVVTSLLLALGWGCATTHQVADISIDILVPASLHSPYDSKNIGIIYRNPVFVDDISKFVPYFDHADSPTNVFSHNPVAYHYIETFRTYLTESGRFDQIELLPDLTGPLSLDEGIEFTAIPDSIRILYRNTYPDYELLLFSDLIYSRSNPFYSEEMQLFYMMVEHKAMWQIIGLNQTDDIFLFNKADTTIISGSAPSKNLIWTIFPTQEQSMLEAAEESALSFAKMFVPHWLTVLRRIYESGNYEMQQARKYALGNHWDDAVAIWEKLITNKNRNIAAKAMFNLALAHEIAGDMEGAMKWVVESYYIFQEKNIPHSIHTKEYIDILGERKRDFKLLEMQLSEPGSP